MGNFDKLWPPRGRAIGKSSMARRKGLRAGARAVLSASALLASVLGIVFEAAWNPAFAGEEIVVGASAAQTGKYARTGQEQLNGIRMWVEDVNAMGGLLGKAVRLVHYDDESQPAMGAELYERLITDDKVDLLIGPYSSGITLSASTVAEKYRVPMVSAGASASRIWARGYKNIFGLYTPAEEYMNQILAFAASRGLARVALIYSDAAFPRSVAAGVGKKVAALEMNLVFEEKYGRDTLDFADTLLKMRPGKPDIVIGGSYLPDSTAFIRQAKENRLSAKIFAFAVGPALPDFGKNLGADAEGVMGNSQWEPNLNLAGIREFVKTYKERHDHLPGYHAAGGYGAGQVLEMAVRQSKSVEPDKIREALFQLDITTIFGRYKVDETGKQIGKPAYTIQWIGGRRELILPSEAATTEPVYPFRPWPERQRPGGPSPVFRSKRILSPVAKAYLHRMNNAVPPIEISNVTCSKPLIVEHSPHSVCSESLSRSLFSNPPFGGNTDSDADSHR